MTWRFMRINLEPQRQRFSLARCQPNKQRLDLVQRRWGLPKSSFPSPVSHPSIPDICYPLFPDGALSGAFSALVAIADGPKDRPATLVHLEIAPQSTLSSLPDFRGHAPVSEFPPSFRRAAMIACPICLVVALPPKSGVRTFPPAITLSTAPMTAAPSSPLPKSSRLIETDRKSTR